MNYEELARRKNRLHDKLFVQELKEIQIDAMNAFNDRFLRNRNPSKNKILDPIDDYESMEFKEYPNKPGTYLIPKSQAETSYWRKKNPGNESLFIFRKASK